MFLLVPSGIAQRVYVSARRVDYIQDRPNFSSSGSDDDVHPSLFLERRLTQIGVGTTVLGLIICISPVEAHPTPLPRCSMNPVVVIAMRRDGSPSIDALLDARGAHVKALLARPRVVAVAFVKAIAGDSVRRRGIFRVNRLAVNAVPCSGVHQVETIEDLFFPDVVGEGVRIGGRRVGGT